ncbi:TetR/AcrR family transcriptional regulator [Gemmata sp.]|uniref:TetR/AcrR family transcriptional regulator n=1 Tax=Gemmata sp. TaxID=1914242 RepID=UPI003F71F362
MPGGRPRQFDAEKALVRAMEVFWRRGYEGATVPELTRAMGINRPSMYAAFGDKEALFRKVLDRYIAGPASHLAEALAAPTARAVAERLLFGAADRLTDASRPAGCLIVQGALACGEGAEPVRRELAAHRETAVRLIRSRLERATEAGDLPADAECGALARFLVTVTHGMAVQAASGATRQELRDVVRVALRAWPA